MTDLFSSIPKLDHHLIRYGMHAHGTKATSAYVVVCFSSITHYYEGIFPHFLCLICLCDVAHCLVPTQQDMRGKDTR